MRVQVLQMLLAAISVSVQCQCYSYTHTKRNTGECTTYQHCYRHQVLQCQLPPTVTTWLALQHYNRDSV